MKSLYIRRITALIAVLLLAALTACSSCRMDTQPSGTSTDTQAQSAQQPSSGTEYVTEPDMESGTESTAEETDAEDSQEATYNDYGEWDIP